MSVLCFMCDDPTDCYYYDGECKDCTYNVTPEFMKEYEEWCRQETEQQNKKEN